MFRICSRIKQFLCLSFTDPGHDGSLNDCLLDSMAWVQSVDEKAVIKVKGKVFYGQEPLSRESTTTECGVNYQLLTVITEVAQWGTPSCSRPQPATDNGITDGRNN